MLANVKGQSLISHVYKRVLSLNLFDEIYVATDHKKIFDEIKKSGGEVVMTSKDHQSGTDRIFEAVDLLNLDFDFIVNVQGDEALISEQQLAPLVKLLRTDSSIELASLCRRNASEASFKDPNFVKVVCDDHQNALFFSRANIPFDREGNTFEYFYHHIGVYAFNKNVIADLKQLKPSSLEKTEMLEQLRWMQAGYRIRMVEVEGDLFGIDTPDDLEKLRTSLNS